jgi:hypothetical protein
LKSFTHEQLLGEPTKNVKRQNDNYFFEYIGSYKKIKE